MASAKDTFESDTFESNTFACGALRGLGVTIVVTSTPRVFRAKDRAGQFNAEDRRGAFDAADRGGSFSGDA